MSDYPVIQVEGVSEDANYSDLGGLPTGVRGVTFTSTQTPFAKRSIYALVQLCVLVLLRTPGRDVLSPDSGGALNQIAARPAGESLLMLRRGEIGVAISTTERQIHESQTVQDLPPEERLRSFLLLDANYDSRAQEWLIIARVISEAGGAADVLL